MATAGSPTNNLTFKAASICSLAAVFYFFDYFIQAAPSIMIKQLMQAFSINIAGIGILSSAFYYSYTLMQIPGGFLLDRFGARKTLTIAVLLVSAGVYLFAMAHSLFAAGSARFLIGLGSSVAFISTLYLITRWFKHKYFSIFAGCLQLLGCLGAIFSQTILAKWINVAGWRPVLFELSGVTLVLTLLILLFVRNSPTTAPQGITTSPTIPDKTETKQLLHNHQLWWACFISFLAWIPVACIGALWGVPYIMQSFGVNNIQGGLVCAFFWLGVGIGSIFTGWISMHLKRRCMPMQTCFMIGFIAGILLLLIPYLKLWLAAIVFFGLGVTAANQAMAFCVVKDNIHKESFGMASSLINMSAIIGGAVTQPLIGWLLQWQWTGGMINNTPVYSSISFQHAFMILPIFNLIGVLICRYKLTETYCKHKLH